MAAGNDLTFLQNLINSFRSDGSIDGNELQDLFQTIRNLLSANNTSVLNLAYDNALTYDTPATAETSGNPSYAEFDDRFWRSKTDGNTGNEPPSNASISENTDWIEVSKAEANAFEEWSPGIYGAGLIIVFHNDALFKLQAAQRPYESTDIDAEIIAGDWINMTGGDGGGGIDPADIVNDFSTHPNDASKVAGANAVYSLFKILASNDVDYDSLQEVVDFIKTIDTNGELVAAIDSAVGNSNWRKDFNLTNETGSVITFDKGENYGFPTAITGNITFSFTNAVSGMTQLLKHNDTVKPTVPTSAVYLGGDPYDVNEDNYYYLTPIQLPDTSWQVHFTTSTVKTY